MINTDIRKLSSLYFVKMTLLGSERMTFQEAVSKKIYELCDIYNYTPNRLAEMSAVPPTTLQDMLMKRVKNPSSYVIYKLCKTLKLEMKAFFDSDIFKQIIE